MKVLAASVRFLLFFTFVCGVFYPLSLTFLGQLLWPYQSHGSLIFQEGRLIGSELIGQLFEKEGFFHGRPSASSYDPLPGKASQLPLSSNLLQEQVKQRVGADTGVPSELLLASGSGLDPHISLETALYQVDRIALARGMDETGKQKLIQMIYKEAQPSRFGFLGPQVVSVLSLNRNLLP